MPKRVVRNLSLRAKILAVSVGTALLLGTITTVFVRGTLEQALLRQLELRGQALARHLATTAVAPVLTERFLDLELMVRESQRAEEDIEYIFVLSPRGEVLAHTFGGGFPTALRGAGGPTGMRRLALGDGEVLDISTPLLGGSLGTLRLGMAEAAVRREVGNTVRGVLWIVVSCTVAAAAFAIVLALAISQPLGHLADAADHVRDGRFPDALPAGTNDEVGRLAAAFNAMVVGRREADEDQARLIAELQEALANVKLLQGMLPICASCKRVRDDKGYWNQIESYISTHTDVRFSHGLCPDCLKREYPQYADRVGGRLVQPPPDHGG